MATIQDIKKQIQLDGNIRDVKWVTEKFQAGRLYIHGVLLTPQTFEQYRLIIRIINDIYENAWDVDFDVEKVSANSDDIYIYIKGIYIWFSEITIRNRNDKTHQIKDLIIKFELRNNGTNLSIGDLLGGRMSLSYAEYQSNYFHSHLSIWNNNINSDTTMPYLSHFCTGSGEINIYRSNINGDGLTEANFTTFAVQLMTLTSYESIEGTPYRYMSNISARPQSGSPIYIDNRTKRDFFNFILNYYKSTDRTPIIDFSITSSKTYSINHNETFMNFINLVPFDENSKRRFFSTKGFNGVEYAFGAAPGWLTPPEIRSTFIFRGEEKRFVVDPPPTNRLSEINYRVNPDLINYLKQTIEYELNKNKIRQSTIDRYKVESSDATESIQSNPVPVSTNS